MKVGSLILALLVMLISSPVTAQRFLREDGTLELVPAALRLQDELARGGEDLNELAAFYGTRAFVPIWVHKPERRVALLSALDRASDHGLPTELYEIDALRQMQGEMESLEAQARLEVKFSKSYLLYARHMSSGIIRPRDVHREILHQPDIKTVEELLIGLVRASSTMAYLRSLIPDTQEYAALLAEKQRLERLIEAEQISERIPTRGMMRPGHKSNRVVMVRERLTVLGYGELGTSRIYDEALMEVVRQFQEDHKLRPDAVMGPATLGALNKSAADRLEHVLVNIERRRWMNFDRSGRHIRVNLPDFTMAVLDDDVPTFRSDVVIGKTGKDYRTPEFSKDMTHLIVNPYWHVPRSIAGREYLPLLKRDPLALSRRGMLLLNRSGRVLNTAGADFSGYTERNFPFFIKQPPGNKNALGRVKFMFPNRTNIYLHDTPAKKLFRRDRRAYSHGCIRVQRPFELAYHLLSAQTEDPKGTFNYFLKRKRERQINLETPVPVHLVYHTAFMADDGTIAYREDLYRRDQPVFRALLDAGVRVQGLSG